MRCLAKTWLLVLGALLVAGACTPDFEDPWLVKDLRILAIAADPPEVLVPIGPLPAQAPKVNVRTLVVDPRKAADATVRWWVRACSADEDNCDDAAYAEDIVAPKTTRLDAIQFEVVASLELITKSLENDIFRGFGGVPVLVELHIDDPDGPEVIGLKRLVYGVIDPPQKVGNKNPVLDVIKADDAPIAAKVEAKAGDKVVFLPEPVDTSKEKYVVRTFTGGERTLDEYLSYFFFVTSGALSHERTGGKPNQFVENKKVEDITSEWTAPEEPGSGTLWVVVRDDRGGATWTAVPYEVTP
ncbi:MAG: hypothetical protein KC503_14515 [Myxococcales bacterium]|nr:hypothetical protein [Myxococcales bacterium]